jgi:hypothetical protein
MSIICTEIVVVVTFGRPELLLLSARTATRSCEGRGGRHRQRRVCLRDVFGRQLRVGILLRGLVICFVFDALYIQIARDLLVELVFFLVHFLVQVSERIQLQVLAAWLPTCWVFQSRILMHLFLGLFFHGVPLLL